MLADNVGGQRLDRRTDHMRTNHRTHPAATARGAAGRLASAAIAVLAALMPTGAAAVELPTTAITMLPDGAEVVRSGALPAGDDWVGGLPAGLDEGEVSVLVDGMADPQWRLALPAPATQPAWDRAAEDARAHVLHAAEADLERSRLRRELCAEACAGYQPAAGDPPESMPDGAAVAAMLAFAIRNAADADREQAAAVAALAAAQDPARAQGEEASAAGTRALEIVHAGGHAVTVRYRLHQAGWRAAYRIEIQGATAQLVLLARAEQWGDRWGALPLSFSTRPALGSVLLPAFSITRLGVEDAVGGFTVPRAGPASREAGRNDALRRLMAIQRDDGSFGDGRFAVATSALDALCFLGAGYDGMVNSRAGTSRRWRAASPTWRPRVPAISASASWRWPPARCARNTP